MIKMNSPFGSYTLLRYPLKKKETLQAWDAADEYLLAYLKELFDQLPNDNAESAKNILIINDNFGALTLSLHSYSPTVQNDSYVSQQGILANLEKNGLDHHKINFLSSTEPLQNAFNYVLIKIPKSNAYLEDVLCSLQSHINPDTKIISAAMSKNIHTNTLKIFEQTIGDTTTSLAKKKARLVFSQFTNKSQHTNTANSYTHPVTSFELALEDKTFTIQNYSNVFSREKLDIGTRFLLENLPASKEINTIIDLGCGNGILGLVAAHQHPTANIIFVDESYMAVESAKLNFKTAFKENNRQATFIASNCLGTLEENSVDLILCNPPFHQNHAIGDHIAWQMFNDAHKVLKKEGELWIVGNHHLAYHAKLKTIFGGYSVVNSNKKFAIMFSRKT